MLNQYSRDALTILMDDLKPFPDTQNVLTQKLTSLENTVTDGMEFRYENFDIIPELEKAAIHNVTLVEEKKLGFQFHLSTSPVIVHLDRLFVQALLLKLLTDLLATARQGSAIHIYVTDNDGKCIIESINQGGIINRQASDGYFKKYRITKPLHNGSAQTEKALPVYQHLVEDMGGELVYSFTKEKGNYFRLKLALA